MTDIFSSRGRISPALRRSVCPSLALLSGLALLLLSFCHSLAEINTSRKNDPLDIKLIQSQSVNLNSSYPWKRNIKTTTFWIGNNRNSYTSTVNWQSAWDGKWARNYGGEDDPKNRRGYRPKGFFPTLNPFYIALPFNDVKYPDKAKRWIPWYSKTYKGRYQSTCKGRWVAIHFRGKYCFATWEDVGPFRYDNAEYVFGNGPVCTPTGAGLDVSPAVKDYLGMDGDDLADWRFVEDNEIPGGPWLDYGEKAAILAMIKNGHSTPSTDTKVFQQIIAATGSSDTTYTQPSISSPASSSSKPAPTVTSSKPTVKITAPSAEAPTVASTEPSSTQKSIQSVGDQLPTVTLGTAQGPSPTSGKASKKSKAEGKVSDGPQVSTFTPGAGHPNPPPLPVIDTGTKIIIKKPFSSE